MPKALEQMGGGADALVEATCATFDKVFQAKA